MIEFIFTIDYEIYGNGTGALRDLVYEPAEHLTKLFRRRRTRFVTFVEVAELEIIEINNADPALELVKQQIQGLHRDGFEIGLHLHPQWFNARHEDRRWILDYSEYNLCTLSRTRIVQIVDRSIAYLRRILRQPDFTPVSFRAGNWLFQPTQIAASVLAEKGIKIDSSVFKGGVQHNHGLDYRPACKNGYYWLFETDVNQPNPLGSLLELPIYTDMVPAWRVPTGKRMSFSNNFSVNGRSFKQKWNRMRDFARFRYPLKLDFCRMTLNELTSMMSSVVKEDQGDPSVYRPIVAIGHTKDLQDLQTVDAFLSFLQTNGITVATFESIHRKFLASVSKTSPRTTTEVLAKVEV